MGIYRNTFRKHPTGPLLVIALPVITFCMLVAPVLLPHPGNSISIAFAQETNLQSNTLASVQTRLTPNQQQEIIDKNVRIRKLQEGIIDHKIKILGSKKQERTLLGDLEKIENELQSQKRITCHPQD